MNRIRLYSTSYCPYCVSAKRFLQQQKLDFDEESLDGKDELRAKLSQENGGWRTVPMIFVGSKFIGGYQDMMALHQQQKFLALVNGED
jgi:glutaredoxin 3